MPGTVTTDATAPQWRLLPQIIDDLAREMPTKIFTSIPKSNDIADGFRDLTAREFADAVDRAAWFLERQLGRGSSQVLVYLGPSDLVYPILALAAPKAGYIIFWTSPRNSLQAHCQLLEATQSSIFLTPAVVPPGIDVVIQKTKIRHLIFPELPALLDAADKVTQYPFTKSYDESYLEPCMILHTSGSTGIPKPVVIPSGYLCYHQAHRSCPWDGGLKTMDEYMREQPGRIFHSFPMFHGGGVCMFFIGALFWDQIPVLPPNKPLTPELADAYHRSGQVTSSFLPPAILEGISKVPEYVRNLQKLKFIIFSGAPLAHSVGGILRQRTRLVNLVGQTETGALYQLYVEDEDYLYVRFGSKSNIELRLRSEGVYEAVVIRKTEVKPFQAAFMVFPELDELRTNDLFTRHPEPLKKDYWIHCGRADDIIVFETGEKINPVTMEQVIETSPKVRSAIIVGEGRFQSAVLIELQLCEIISETERKALIEELWPIVQQANVDCPAHGRVVKSLILFTDPAKPFLRTAKGSIKRKETTKLYKENLDVAYTTAEENPSQAHRPIDPTWERDELETYLRETILQIASFSAMGVDDDFFSLGMDSLQALELARTISSAFRDHPHHAKLTTASLIYANSTLRTLCQAISSILQAQNGPKSEASATDMVVMGKDSRRDRLEDMQRVLSSYTSSLPLESSKHKSSSPPASIKSVLLTGSTGGLGSYILTTLASNPTISHIYCLNRTADAANRQAQTNRTRGLPTTFDPSRLTFVHCDLSRPDLGLDPVIYKKLVNEVTDIIHNAWTVNFNRSLSSFAATNVAGVRHLADLSSASKFHAKLFFVSSLGAVVRWNLAGHPGPVPEEVVSDMDVAEELGYAESKHVAERFLDTAHASGYIRACVVRVGQIAGPVHRGIKGEWTRAEWLPLLIASSKQMGLVPDSLGGLNTVDWVPIDLMAGSLVELVLGGADTEPEQIPVYHLINPSRITWKELYPVVERYLASTKVAGGRDITVVPYSQWLEKLQEVARITQTEEEINRNPAVKILHFFDSLAKDINGAMAPGFSTAKTVEASEMLRNCGPVTPEWMELWMKQWNF